MSSWIDYFIYLTVVIAASLLLGFVGFLGAVLLMYYIHTRNRKPEPYIDHKPTEDYSLPVFNPIEATVITYDDIMAIAQQDYYDDGALKVPYDMYEEYRNYLKSSRWKKLSALVKKRDKHRCLRCGHIGYLQVHHTHYTGIYEDFNFSLDQLETICDLCHRDVHKGILPMSKD